MRDYWYFSFVQNSVDQGPIAFDSSLWTREGCTSSTCPLTVHFLFRQEELSFPKIVGKFNQRIPREFMGKPLGKVKTSQIKDEFLLVTFHIFHPKPDPTSKLRQNLVVHPVVLAGCCDSMFLALGIRCFLLPSVYTSSINSLVLEIIQNSFI